MTEETGSVEQEAVSDEWAEAMSEQAEAEGGEAVEQVENAPLQNLQPEAGVGATDASLESILDIPVTLSVRIGTTRISIKNLLQLNQGSVVELERLAGEPLDVLVNDTLVAHGEVVVVNEKYGIRLTDIVSAQERVKKLQ